MSKQKPQDIILEGVVGSTAYGLATPTSDIDVKGIHVAPFRSVLGLDGPVVVTETVDHTGPDWAYHEVGKFVRLALKSNPTTLEMLWLNDYSILTDEGEALIDIRRSFLSEPAIRGAYGAYAKAQADRLVRRNEEGKEGFSSDTKSRTEKHGRHCMRLLLQGTQLLATGTMTVDVSYYREFLFDMGELAGNDPQGFYDQYKIHADRFDRTETKLPQFPDRLTADDDLVNIRLQMSHHG